MPASRATAFERLAPDQRAAVELVLRQGRSYAELSDLLGMPEETIRSRARGGISALAPDLPAPGRSGEIADWLLGQQSEAHASRTRALVLSDPAAHRWAAEVAAPLRGIPGGEAVPALPTGPEADRPRMNGKSHQAAAPGGERAGRRPPTAEAGTDASPAAADDAAAGGDDWFSEPAAAAHEREEPRGSSSRLGGALLIGGAVLVTALVLAFVLLRGDEEREPAASTPAPTATATPVSTVAGQNDVLLRGPAGSTSVGLMRLFQANDGTVRFALAAQGVTPNRSGERYSIWFTREGGSPRLLGDVKDPVGDKGELTSAGPANDQTDEFVQWLQAYDSVAVTLDEAGAKEPGKVILSGNLPTG